MSPAALWLQAPSCRLHVEPALPLAMWPLGPQRVMLRGQIADKGTSECSTRSAGGRDALLEAVTWAIEKIGQYTV